MLDVLEVIDQANAAGERVVVATVIDTIRSAPRQPGAKMVVRENGRFVGSVSGGCVEADVVERAKAIFLSGTARACLPEWQASKVACVPVGLVRMRV